MMREIPAVWVEGKILIPMFARVKNLKFVVRCDMINLVFRHGKVSSKFSNYVLTIIVFSSLNQVVPLVYDTLRNIASYSRVLPIKSKVKNRN